MTRQLIHFVCAGKYPEIVKRKSVFDASVRLIALRLPGSGAVGELGPTWIVISQS